MLAYIGLSFLLATVCRSDRGKLMNASHQGCDGK